MRVLRKKGVKHDGTQREERGVAVPAYVGCRRWKGRPTRKDKVRRRKCPETFRGRMMGNGGKRKQTRVRTGAVAAGEAKGGSGAHQCKSAGETENARRKSGGEKKKRPNRQLADGEMHEWVRGLTIQRQIEELGKERRAR